jgi:integrase/recombinase XerC
MTDVASVAEVVWLKPDNPLPALLAAGVRVPLIVAAHLAWMRQEGLAESTIDKRRRVLARVSAFTGAPVWDATEHQLADWRAGLTAGPDAIAADLSQVREFFRWLQLEGLRDDNPARRLARPKLARRLPRPIPDDQLLCALQLAPPRIRPWLVLAAWMGFRAKEIALLRRERVIETGRPPGILVACDATKGTTERYVPMSDFVLAELVPVLPASGWVFRRLDGGRGPNTPGLVSKLAGQHLRDCGIAATLHQLRHRFGTASYDVDHDLRVVQELMGHANIATTALYTKISSASAVATVQALPAPGYLRVVPRDIEKGS